MHDACPGGAVVHLAEAVAAVLRLRVLVRVPVAAQKKKAK